MAGWVMSLKRNKMQIVSNFSSKKFLLSGHICCVAINYSMKMRERVKGENGLFEPLFEGKSVRTNTFAKEAEIIRKKEGIVTEIAEREDERPS